MVLTSLDTYVAANKQCCTHFLYFFDKPMGGLWLIECSILKQLAVLLNELWKLKQLKQKLFSNIPYQPSIDL